MSYAVSFTDYRPSRRYAPAVGPWVTARIEEAPTSDGPWTTLETIALDPVDSDPERPRSREFTTDQATLPEGWYRIVWIDADGAVQPTAPRLNSAAATTASWAPTVADVAKLSPAYTRHPVDGQGEQAGSEQKVFDDTTDPTATDVQGYIDNAVREIAGRVGVSTARLELYGELAKQAAAWHAAKTIEAEKAPDGADESVGAYSWKQSSYVACLTELISQARPILVR